jgi:hypothetical protein
MANALPHGLLHREPTQGRQQKDATVPAHGLSSMQQRHLPFQRWLLLASAVAALLIAFLGWHIYESHRFFGQVGTDFVRQTETIARVRQLRWKLTQAAHHVVLFGDGEDRRRAYGHGKRRLEAELDAGVGLPQQVADRASLAVLAELSRELGAIEGEAMAAARDGRRDDALSLLHSPDYVEGTGVFCARADAHLKAVYERLEERTGQVRLSSSRLTSRFWSLPAPCGGYWVSGFSAGGRLPIPKRDGVSLRRSSCGKLRTCRLWARVPLRSDRVSRICLAASNLDPTRLRGCRIKANSESSVSLRQPDAAGRSADRGPGNPVALFAFRRAKAASAWMHRCISRHTIAPAVTAWLRDGVRPPLAFERPASRLKRSESSTVASPDLSALASRDWSSSSRS